MDVARRPLLTEPGEPLLVPQPPLEAAIRWGTFQEAFGLAPEEIVISSLVALPLPLYPARWPLGRRRWSGAKPEAMWHPLMWLPERLAGRAVLERDPHTGEPTKLESRDLWAVRVMIELSFAGFYDLQTGAWIDVLSMVGLDIATPEVQERVARWLDGAPDEVLDTIDLSRNVDVPGDVWWAIDAAEDLSDSLWMVSWALASDELSGALDDVVIHAAETVGDDAGLAGVLGMICSTARIAFAYVPVDESVEDEASSEEQFWADASVTCTSLDYGDDEAVGAFIESLAARLATMRDFYWGEIDAFAAHAADVEASLPDGDLDGGEPVVYEVMEPIAHEPYGFVGSLNGTH